MERKFNTIDLAYIALGAVIIAACSWISIPAEIPFTLQTFAVFAVLDILGGKRGTVSILVYILLGAVGAPVFSGFSGGFNVIIGPTGGYIVGFLLTGLFYWMFSKRFGKKRYIRIIALCAGLIILYTFGTAWFLFVYNRTSGVMGLSAALVSCVLPFVIPDLAKLVLAVFISKRIRKHLP